MRSRLRLTGAVGLVVVLSAGAFFLAQAFRNDQIAAQNTQASAETKAAPADAAVQTPRIQAGVLNPRAPLVFAGQIVKRVIAPELEGSVEALLETRARSENEAVWMDENGYPPNLDLKSWSRTELESLSRKGNVTAMNMLAHLRIEQGENNLEMDGAARKYGSAYAAKLRAAFYLGLIGPGSNVRAPADPSRLVVRDLKLGLAWDLVAQRFGDTSMVAALQHVRGPDGLPIILDGLTLAAAMSTADSLMISRYNPPTNRPMRYPAVSARYGERRQRSNRN